MAKDCHDTALSYLEHRERSAFEIKSHLKSKEFSEGEIEKELQYLQELHYVDDARYCEYYLRYGMKKGRGPVRLQMELKEKGIDSELIQGALDESFDRKSEKEAAMKEVQKLLCTGSKLNHEWNDESSEETYEERIQPDEKIIAKIGRKLASMGYHTDIIYDVIGQIRKSSRSTGA